MERKHDHSVKTKTMTKGLISFFQLLASEAFPYQKIPQTGY